VSPPAPASSSEIRLLIDRLSSLDGSIKSLQQRLDEHERKTQQAETVLQKQITTMLDQRDKELLSALEEQIQAVVDSVEDANAHDGVGEEILQQVGQLGQEAREAHLELHKDLEERSDRTQTAEKRCLGGLKELKDEMHRSKTEIDSLRSVVCQQSQMLGLIVEVMITRSEKKWRLNIPRLAKHHFFIRLFHGWIFSNIERPWHNSAQSI